MKIPREDATKWEEIHFSLRSIDLKLDVKRSYRYRLPTGWEIAIARRKERKREREKEKEGGWKEKNSPPEFLLIDVRYVRCNKIMIGQFSFSSLPSSIRLNHFPTKIDGRSIPGILPILSSLSVPRYRLDLFSSLKLLLPPAIDFKLSHYNGIIHPNIEINFDNIRCLVSLHNEDTREREGEQMLPNCDRYNCHR